jgi:histidine triad (HIT) family protein
VKDCIFCQIVQNNIPCVKVYETGNVLAFLDVSPVIKGHTLVIPKKHVVNILDLPKDLAPELHVAVQKVGQGLLKGLGAEGFNLGMNNFEAAGQLVMHAHYHLIPRFAGDGLKLWPQKSYENNDEMHSLARNIRSGISDV